MITIDTHTVEESLLSKGWVLDVGCRGFGFARELSERGCQVLALDPDPSITAPSIPNVIYEKKALVAKPTPSATYASWSTGEGNHLCVGKSVPWYAQAHTVPCVTIAQLMSQYGVKEFDVVKLDCEGSEFEILPAWPGPIAKQISVEFHDFTGANPHNPPQRFYDLMLAHIGQWYTVARHEMMDHPCGIRGYWDSLFVRR